MDKRGKTRDELIGFSIKSLRKSLSETQEQFAEKIGIKQPSLSIIEKGGPADKSTLENIVENYKVSLDDLFNGRDFKNNKAESDDIASEPHVSYNKQKSLYKADHSLIFLPLKAIAGYMTVYKEPGYQNQFEKLLIPNYSHCDTAIEVDGDSMFPTFASRDLLLCKRIDDHDFLEFGRAYVIILHDQQVLLKRVYEHESEDFLTLVSDNDTKLNSGKELYPPQKLRKEKIAAVFKVHGSLSNNTGWRKLFIPEENYKKPA